MAGKKASKKSGAKKTATSRKAPAKTASSRAKSKKTRKPTKKGGRGNRLIVILVAVAVVSCVLYFALPWNPPETTDKGQNDTVPEKKAEKPRIDVSELEARIHDIVNEKRSEMGLPELRWNTILNSIARSHSGDMAEGDYLAHEDSEGRGFEDRYKDAGFNCMVFSESLIFRGDENIIRTNLYGTANYVNGVLTSYDWKTQEEVASSVVEGWIDSFDERERIYKPYWETEGIGVAIKDNTVYVTQNLC